MINKDAGVEYRGMSGVTADCLRALSNLLQESIFFDEIAYLISAPIDSTGCRNHAFLIREEEGRRTYIIRTGFRSGYSGEGPKGLSSALCILRSFGFWIEEIEAKQSVFNKIEGSGLTYKELTQLLQSEKNRWGHIEKYLYNDEEWYGRGLITRHADVAIPLRIVDQRLHDLIPNFWRDPDSALSKGYKRLEDIVRRKSGLRAFSTSLMSKAFLSDNAQLGWDVEGSEAIGRANLFVGTYMAFRNPRAHKEDDGSPQDEEYLAELLQLNMLYRLEKEAKRLDVNIEESEE